VEGDGSTDRTRADPELLYDVAQAVHDLVGAERVLFLADVSDPATDLDREADRHAPLTVGSTRKASS